MAQILTGTASWTDPTLLAAHWYPDEATTPEDRLRYYASRFPLVEVDSTYYSLPAERTAVLWADRTPDNFTFDFKAFRLFTGHPTPTKALPKSVRESLPSDSAAKTNVYSKDLPSDVVDEIWDMYRRGLMPVHSAGKLGAVFLQFPKWFFFGHDNLEHIAEARERLPDYPMAVEFRQPSWMNEKHRDETLRFLREHEIAYTSVDEPQGTVPASRPSQKPPPTWRSSASTGAAPKPGTSRESGSRSASSICTTRVSSRSGSPRSRICPGNQSKSTP